MLFVLKLLILPLLVYHIVTGFNALCRVQQLCSKDPGVTLLFEIAAIVLTLLTFLAVIWGQFRSGTRSRH